MKTLEQQIDSESMSRDKQATYKHYYLSLKKDLRLFEEAIDEVKYGYEDKSVPIDITATLEKDIDLLGDVDANMQRDSKNNKDVNLLDLDVGVETLDLQTKVADLEPVPEPVYLMPQREEAFDFLSDKPSAEDFINIK